MCVCVCTFQPGNITGWGSDGVEAVLKEWQDLCDQCQKGDNSIALGHRRRKSVGQRFRF